MPSIQSLIKIKVFVLLQFLLSVRSLKEMCLVFSLAILHKPKDMSAHLRTFHSVEFAAQIVSKLTEVIYRL